MYAQDGVDTKEGDSFSAFAGSLCKMTYNNSPYVKIRDFSKGHFRGPRGFQLSGLPEDFYIDATPDGEGTKVVLIDAAQMFFTGGNGIVAMTCGDITRWGGLPLLIINNLDVATLGKINSPENLAARMLLWGLKNVCDQQGLVMYKGETAELGKCVGSDNPGALLKYLWSAVAIGVYNPKTVITGDEVEDGMDVLALREPSARNNGVSSLREGGKMNFGGSFYQNPDAVGYLASVAAPATLYDKFLAEANGWFSSNFKPIVPIKLISHVTGGSIKSKFAEDILFPRGLSADLTNLWEPSKFFKQVRKWRGMSEEECYEVWCNNNGALAVMDPNYSDLFITLGAKRGIQVTIAGQIKKRKKPSVIIWSGYSNKRIVYRP